VRGAVLKVYRVGADNAARRSLDHLHVDVRLSGSDTVPTHDEHEFTNRAACEIHKHSYSEQIVDAFKLMCSTK
jgi:hypothetical protein